MAYRELSTNELVSEENAQEYVLDKINNDEELQKEVVEWFFSGNWIQVREDEEE